MAWANYTYFQHFSHLSTDLIHNRFRDSLEPLLEGLIINDFDLMFCQTSLAARRVLLFSAQLAS